MTCKHHTHSNARLVFWALCLWLGSACESAPDQLTDSESEPAADSGAPRVQAEQRALEEPHISLTAVWGAARDDVWAVGSEGNMAHFDGERWQAAPRLTQADLTGIHGHDANDVWAVGRDVVLHWDGTKWSVALEDIAETLLGVWQNAVDDVWMVGLAVDIDRGVIRHWNGDKWTWTVLGGVSSVWDVWNSPEHTLWVGGTSASGSGFVAQGLDRDLMRAAYGGGSPRGLWGSADDDIWVAPYAGALQHWDGASWTEHAIGADDMRLLGISGSGSDDVWCVGLHGAMLHWDGHTWSSVASGTEATLWSVWAASAADAWAVGGEIVHWDGTQWRPVSISH